MGHHCSQNIASFFWGSFLGELKSRWGTNDVQNHWCLLGTRVTGYAISITNIDYWWLLGRIGWHQAAVSHCRSRYVNSRWKSCAWGPLQNQGASKRILEKFLNIWNRAQHRFHQRSELRFFGTVFNEALQYTTTIDMDCHFHGMWCKFLKHETSSAGGHQLHVLLQDEIGMKMLTEFQGFALQFIGKGLLKLKGCFF